VLESCPWSRFEPAAIEFCERRLCAWVVEPANTWSNIGFVLVGLLILFKVGKESRPDLKMIGLTAVLVGIGSTLFHMTGTRWGEVIDVSAMYLISSLFIVFAAQRLWALPMSRFVMTYLVLATVTMAALVLSKTNGIWLFAAHITVAVLLELQAFRTLSSRAQYRDLGLMAITFTVAFTSWALDVRHIICNPDNHIFGGHALWHLANATCLWFYYRFQKQFVKI
jgi:hypothetical protein